MNDIVLDRITDWKRQVISVEISVQTWQAVNTWRGETPHPDDIWKIWIIKHLCTLWPNTMFGFEATV